MKKTNLFLTAFLFIFSTFLGSSSLFASDSPVSIFYTLLLECRHKIETFSCMSKGWENALVEEVSADYIAELQYPSTIKSELKNTFEDFKRYLKTRNISLPKDTSLDALVSDPFFAPYLGEKIRAIINDTEKWSYPRSTMGYDKAAGVCIKKLAPELIDECMSGAFNNSVLSINSALAHYYAFLES